MGNSEKSRALALATAERLFRLQGYSATGLAQIIEESGSPKGSFYYLFPDGKTELALQVLERYVATGVAFLSRAGQDNLVDPDHYIHAICDGLAAEMAASQFQLGCIIQNMTIDKVFEVPAVAEKLQSGAAAWESCLSDQLEKRGLDQPSAQSRAKALLAALEGARTLARIQSSTEPFKAVARAFTSPAK